MLDKSVQFDPSKFETVITGNIANITYADDDAYIKGTDIPLAQLKAVAEYDSAYAKAFTDTVAEVAKTTMVDDSSISRIIATAPYSVSKRGSIDVKVDREKTFRNPLPGGTDITKTAISVVTTIPQHTVPKSHVRSLEAMLTELLVK